MGTTPSTEELIADVSNQIKEFASVTSPVTKIDIGKLFVINQQTMILQDMLKGLLLVREAGIK